MDLDTYYRLIKYLDDLILPAEYNSSQLQSFKSKARHYIVHNGILYKKNTRKPHKPLRVVKPSEVETILYSFHADPLAGHFGFHETYRAIGEKYFWPQMGDDIK
jgi:hypothetical protein